MIISNTQRVDKLNQTICDFCSRCIDSKESYFVKAEKHEKTNEVAIYNLCERCNEYINKYCKSIKNTTFMNEFSDHLNAALCPKCGKRSVNNFRFDLDISACIYICEHCSHKWIQDLSFASIDKLIQRSRLGDKTITNTQMILYCIHHGYSVMFYENFNGIISVEIEKQLSEDEFFKITYSSDTLRSALELTYNDVFNVINN